ncbi:hypothetical protein [Catellatospora chokoriensis]|uniref:hypothetical protein n=1 Tax=Catellatospora chokoriensis TaxID=310353 RepID=UPI00177D6236|nr:hypothetical protein [Catellatospora chokoriensis]
MLAEPAAELAEAVEERREHRHVPGQAQTVHIAETLGDRAEAVVHHRQRGFAL